MAETAHDLKTWPAFFDAVADGRKTFEVRKNDRGFQSGDVLVLRKYDPHTRLGGRYISRQGYPTTEPMEAETVRVRVTYVLSGFGIEPGYVCMGIAPVRHDASLRWALQGKRLLEADHVAEEARGLAKRWAVWRRIGFGYPVEPHEVPGPDLDTQETERLLGWVRRRMASVLGIPSAIADQVAEDLGLSQQQAAALCETAEGPS